MEKLKMFKKKQRNGDGEWTSCFAGDPKVNAELKKLTNSAGWLAASRKVLPSNKSPSSSRASTPSNISTNSKSKKLKKKKRKGKDKTKESKNGSKESRNEKKKFRMVLEKDEDFEIDYVSPEEEEATTEDSDFGSKGLNSEDSDHEFSFDEEEDDVSSLGNGSIQMTDDYSDVEMEEDFPSLQLPESSKDLLVPNKLVLPVLGVYETLRHFRSCLRLSPMLFEDFCAALMDEETNILLTECYISVLKSILREEDAAGVLFGPHDQKDSIWAAVGFIDHLTWTEIVRGFFESIGEHPEALKVVTDPKFPRVKVEDKILVLKTLTDIYLTSNKIRDQLMTDGVIHYDDNCRVCHKLGDLLCCETCPAVYHLACCDPPLVEVPDDEWQCEICVAHKLNGVYNCESQQEFKSQYVRHEPIGVDRHGNKYWFLARRLIVEGTENVWYYSTLEQYEELLSRLDPDRYEMILCEALKDVTEDFPKQSKITEELTKEALPDEKTTMYLDALKARVKREKEEKIEKERLKIMEEEKRKQKEKDELKKEKDEKLKDEKMDTDEQKASTTANTETKQPDSTCTKTSTDQTNVPVETNQTIPVIKEGVGDSMAPDTKDTDQSTSSASVVTESKPLTPNTIESQPLTPNAIGSQPLTQAVTLSQPVVKTPVVSQTVTPITPVSQPSTPELQPSTPHVPGSQPLTPKVMPSQPVASTISALKSLTQSLSQPLTSKTSPLNPTTQPLNPVIIGGTPTRPGITLAPRSTISPVVPGANVTPRLLQGQGKNIQVIKLNQKLQMKPPQTPIQPAGGALPQLKTLFVLNKDGTKTQITLGPAGKLMPANTTGNNQSSVNRQILVLNSAKVALPKVTKDLPGAVPRTIITTSAASQLNNTTQQLRQQKPTMTPVTSQSSIPKQELPKPAPVPPKKLTHEEEAELYFRLGEDKAYRHYVNHYTENNLALNKLQHKEERDRERYLSYKFSLFGEGQFKWIGDTLGSEKSMLDTLRSTLMHLEHQIPLCFMHTKWERYRKAWGKIVMGCDTPQNFAAALGILEMATRNVVKRSVWRNSNGLPKMKRVSVADKEDWDKRRKHKLRADEEESNRNAVWVKYPFPIKSSLVWKVRGEEYRMTGYGGWIWVSTTRLSKSHPYRSKPFTLVHDMSKGTPVKAGEGKPIKMETDTPEKKEGTPLLPDIDTDSEKSTSTTSTTTTKSADLTEDKGIFDTLVQEASSQSKPIVTSSNDDIVMPAPDAMTSSKSESDSTTSSGASSNTVTSQSKSPSEVYDSIINSCDVINVSENLLKRTPIYNKKWSASKVDILLGWRMVQKEKENEKSETKSITSCSSASDTKPVVIDTKPVTMATDSVTTTTDVKKPTEVKMATSVAVSNKPTDVIKNTVAMETNQTLPVTEETSAVAKETNDVTNKEDSEIDVVGGVKESSNLDEGIKPIENGLQELPKSGNTNSMPMPDNIPCIKEEIQSDTEAMPRTCNLPLDEPMETGASTSANDASTNDSETNTDVQTVTTTSASMVSVPDVDQSGTIETISSSDKNDEDAIVNSKPADSIPTTSSDVTTTTDVDMPQISNDATPSTALDATNATTSNTISNLEDSIADATIITATTKSEDITNDPISASSVSDMPQISNDATPSTASDATDATSSNTISNLEDSIADATIITATTKSEDIMNDAISASSVSESATTNSIDATASVTNTDTITTDDTTKLMDSVVETTKTTMVSEDQKVTIIETLTTTITKTTSVSKTIISTKTDEPDTSTSITGSTGAILAKPEGKDTITRHTETLPQKTNDVVTSVTTSVPSKPDHSDKDSDIDTESKSAKDTENNTTDAKLKADATDSGTAATPQAPRSITPVLKEPVVPLPKITTKSSIKAALMVTHVQKSRVQMSRMSRARRVRRQNQNGTLSATQTIWKLQRYRKTSATLKREKTMKLPLPWKFTAGKLKKRSIFRLPAAVTRKLAISGGQWAYRAGFTFGAKWYSGLEQYWFYPCPRPTFSLTWRYKLQNVYTFGAVAHLLRIFWHAIKWDKMTMRPQNDDVVNSVTTDDEIITTELLKRKDNLSTGLHSQYYVRRITMPITDPEEDALRAIKPAEGYTPSRKGLRSSRRSFTARESKKESGPQVQMLWVPEEEIELWQIRQFDIMLKQQQNQTSTSQTKSISSTITKPNSTPTSFLQSEINTFITTPSGGILPTLQNLKQTRINNTVAGPGFNIVKLPLHQNAQILQKSLNSGGGKTVIGKPAPKIVVHSGTGQFTPYKQINDSQSQQAIVRSTPTGTHYIVQGGKLVKPIIIKAGSPVVSTPIQTKSLHPSIRLSDAGSQAIKFNQQPPLLPTLKKSPATIAPRTPSQAHQTQIKLSTSQLSQLMKVGPSTPVRVSVSLGNGRTGVGQIQLIQPGSQVTPTSGQQLMQTRVGGEVKKFLFTLVSETIPPPTPTPVPAPVQTPISPKSPANEVSLKTASLSQRLQQIQRHQFVPGKNKASDMKRLMTDKDPLWGSKPQSAERTSTAPIHHHQQHVDTDRHRKKPISRIQREEGQRQTVVMQVMKSILDRIDRKEELENRKKKREEAILKQKERKEQTEQMKVHNRQTQILHRHRDHLKQDILKRRAVVEKYLTHAVKNELREDQRKHRRGGNDMSTGVPVSKRPKKTSGNAIVTSAVLTENNSKRPIKDHRGNQQSVATKRRRTASPPPETKKTKMINTQSKKKDNKLYCVCKTPYDPTKFYIGCDLCLNWFHGACVGIPESRAKMMNEWICDDCQKAKEEPAQELYCICRTPYDDSKFYIGCDICQDWYHGNCVGISEKDADKIEFYACPRCKNKKKGASSAVAENLLTPSDHMVLTKIIRSLRAHKMAWPFLQPVSKYEVPNYYKVIKKPMDLGTVMNKLPSYTLLSELMGDISLIFDNCRMFNGADSALAKCAEIVESVFVGKMREYRSRRKSK